MLDVTCWTLSVCAVMVPVVVSDPVMAVLPSIFCCPTNKLDPVLANVKLSRPSNRSALDVYEEETAFRTYDAVDEFRAYDAEAIEPDIVTPPVTIKLPVSSNEPDNDIAILCYSY